MRRIAILVLALGACSGPPDRLLPGPCSAHRTGDDLLVVTYTYDAADRLTHFDWDADQGVEYARVTFTADGANMSAGCDLCESSAGTWTFGDTVATRRETDWDRGPYTETYEPDLRFTGDPFDVYALLDLRAYDSMLTHQDDGAALIHYTYDGPPHQGTRTRTGTDGSDDTFMYDADGNLVSWTNDGAPHHLDYADGLVAHDDDVALERDAYGNLTRSRTAFEEYTYDYGCW